MWIPPQQFYPPFQTQFLPANRVGKQVKKLSKVYELRIEL